MAGPFTFRKFHLKSYSIGANTYRVATSPNARENGERLRKWLLEEEKSPVDSENIETMGRLWKFGDNRLVKLQPGRIAMREFLMLLNAEVLTSVTPRDPALLLSGDDAYLSMQRIEGLNLAIWNDAGADGAERRSLMLGAFLALGKLHYGNGVRGILHRDMTVLNLLSPDPLKSGEPADVRFVDLGCSRLVKPDGPFSRFAEEVGELAFNLLMQGFLSQESMQDAVDAYAKGNPNCDRVLASEAMARQLFLLVRPYAGKPEG